MQEEALSLQKPVETCLRGKRKVKTLSLFVFLPIPLSLFPPRLCRSSSAFLEKCSRKKRTVLASFLSSHISHFDDFCKTSFANPFELSGKIGQSLSNVEDSCCWTMRHSAITGIAEGGRHETHTRATWGERATTTTTTTTSTWGEREREHVT